MSPRPDRQAAPLDGIAAEEYEEFRRFLEEACGIVLGDSKRYLVQSRLGRLVAERSLSGLGELVVQLRREASGSSLRRQVIESMTTNETSWFRDVYPFSILGDRVLGDFAGRGLRAPRIWSAACSTGQEAYSISMVVEDFLISAPGRLADVEITATDISPAVLEQAKSGCYDLASVSRGLSTQHRARYFERTGGSHAQRWKIGEAVRRRVRFTRANLLSTYTGLGRFDAIFCRNVLIYFSPASKADILQRMTDLLNPGGYLFLGAAESPSQFSDAFEVVRCNPGIVFRKKQAVS